MYDPTIRDRVTKEAQAKRKELQDHRRRRLMRVIVERYGGFQAALARAAGVSINGLNMALTAIISFGDYRARNIEQAIGLPWGWLDTADPRLPKNLRPDPKPVGKHTGMPSRLTAKLYPGELEKPRVLAHVVEELLAAGYTQRQIAQQLGVHESAVSHALKRERKRPQHAAA